jgi:hypothetical protein
LVIAPLTLTRGLNALMEIEFRKGTSRLFDG